MPAEKKTCPFAGRHARFGLALLLFLFSANPKLLSEGFMAQSRAQSLANTPRMRADSGHVAVEDSSQFLSRAELEEQYAVAKSALRSRDWVQALVALEMVLASNPDYRDANSMLAVARRGVEQDSAEARVARNYVAGMKAKREGDFARARQALRAVNQEQKNFRDAAAQLAELERELQTQPQRPQNDFVLEVSADSLHAAARAAAAQEDWRKAAELYSQLEALEPENLALRKQAEQARVNLLIAQTGLARVEAGGRERDELQIALFIGVIFTLVPVLLLAFSFQLRLRYFLKRGELRRAAQLYESVLQRAPQRLKLYPPLADLYLRLQRTDPAAIKVFKAVQQLNLPTPHRAAIDAILAENS